MSAFYLYLAFIETCTDDYKTHTSCITEAERYEKTVYKGPRKNETKNRKLTPQEKWMEVIEEALTSAPASLQFYIEQISAMENVPRKEKQFRNFASNSLRLFGKEGETIISSIWKHISEVRLKSIEKSQQQQQQLTNNPPTETLDKEETLQHPKEDTKNPIENKSDGKLDAKLVKKAMKKTLKKAPKSQMKMKDLRKILLKRLGSEDVKDKELKKIITQVLDANSKKMKLDGKLISLIN